MDSDFRHEIDSVLSSPSSSKEPQIWAISSGKGGVGKTLTTSSLAISLGRLGFSVVIIDLDLTGANIHTLFNLAPSNKNIRHFFEGTYSLSELAVPTKIPRVSYIQGFWDSWAPIDLSTEQIRSLVPKAKKMNADYILVDLGPGATTGNLELLMFADEKIVVTTPESTSIEKTYRFIESFLCYSLKDRCLPAAYDHMIQTLREYRRNPAGKYFSFRSYLRENTGVQQDYFDGLEKKPLRLLVNSCRSQADSDLGGSMKSVCHKYYDFKLDFIGAIDYDSAAWQSARNREPVLVAQPFTPLAGQFLMTCKQLIDPGELRAVV